MTQKRYKRLSLIMKCEAIRKTNISGKKDIWRMRSRNIRQHTGAPKIENTSRTLSYLKG